jgi:lysozyme family protein
VDGLGGRHFLEHPVSSFDLAIPIVLEHEGGFVNDIHDPGGATKYGLSLRFLKRLGIMVDYDHDGDVDEKDIRAMSRADAVAFYSAIFWDPGSFGDVHDQQCATKLFDAAVNMGAGQANRLALRACGLPDLGSWMPIDAINAAKPSAWLTAMIREQSAFYHQIVARRAESGRFLPGWLQRASWPWPALAAVGVA